MDDLESLIRDTPEVISVVVRAQWDLGQTLGEKDRPASSSLAGAVIDHARQEQLEAVLAEEFDGGEIRMPRDVTPPADEQALTHDNPERVMAAAEQTARLALATI